MAQSGCINSSPNKNNGQTVFPLSYTNETPVLKEILQRYLPTHDIQFPPEYWNIENVLRTAFIKGQSEFVDELMKHSSSLNLRIPPQSWDVNQDFVTACENSQLEWAEEWADLLTNHGHRLELAKVVKGWTAFPLAYVNESPKLEEVLRKHLPNLQTPKYWNIDNVLRNALKRGQSEFIDALMNHSISLNICTPLPKDWNVNKDFITSFS